MWSQLARALTCYLLQSILCTFIFYGYGLGWYGSVERTGQIGLIAQEVEPVLPEIVKTDEQTGLKTVGYLGLVPVLLEAVKEQQDIIERLEARVAALEGAGR